MADISVVNKLSGDIEIIDKDNHSYTIILNNFSGEIEVSSSTLRLRFILHGENEVTSNICLSSSNRQDSISIRGQGFCKFKKVAATVVEVLSNIEVDTLECHIAKITSSCVTTSTLTEWITAEGHIWITDSILEASTPNVGIKSKFVVIDNSNIDLTCGKVFDTENELVLDHIDVYENIDTHFNCIGKVLDESGDPRDFLNVIQDSSSGINIETRRKLYGHTPAVKAGPYDKFRQAIGYTNVNLHRHIDQEGEFESPECASKNYDVGIYALKSIRTTETHYYGDGSLINEIP